MDVKKSTIGCYIWMRRLSGQVESYEIIPIECALENLEGKTYNITAFRTHRVTGNMHVIDWNVCAREWLHLKGLRFHHLGQLLIFWSV